MEKIYELTFIDLDGLEREKIVTEYELCDTIDSLKELGYHSFDYCILD